MFIVNLVQLFLFISNRFWNLNTRLFVMYIHTMTSPCISVTSCIIASVISLSLFYYYGFLTCAIYQTSSVLFISLLYFIMFFSSLHLSDSTNVWIPPGNRFSAGMWYRRKARGLCAFWEKSSVSPQTVHRHSHLKAWSFCCIKNLPHCCNTYKLGFYGNRLLLLLLCLFICSSMSSETLSILFVVTFSNCWFFCEL